jgi:hypothetical protein
VPNPFPLRFLFLPRHGQSSLFAIPHSVTSRAQLSTSAGVVATRRYLILPIPYREAGAVPLASLRPSVTTEDVLGLELPYVCNCFVDHASKKMTDRALLEVQSKARLG